jgi:hypothetical protein
LIDWSELFLSGILYRNGYWHFCSSQSSLPGRTFDGSQM